MSSANTASLLDEIRNAARPFAEGRFVPDWQERAMLLSTLSDYCQLRMKEDSFFDLSAELAPSAPLSRTPLRLRAEEIVLGRHTAPAFLEFNCQYGPLSGGQLTVYDSFCHTLDASEKIVVSGCAHAICHLPMPDDLLLDLCNLLYEEALHLEAVGRFLAIDHGDRPWIPESKQTNWELILASGDAFEYMVTEHCFYEGRGAIASARGAFELQRAGSSTEVLDVMRGLCRQETHHGVTGFYWLKLLDDGGREDSLRRTIRRFSEKEPFDVYANFRGLRQRFPYYLMDTYLRTRSYLKVREAVVTNARSCLLTGDLLIDGGELGFAAERVKKWCGL